MSEELEYDDKFDGFVSPAPAFTSLDSWDIEWEEVDFHDCPSSSEVTTGADGGLSFALSQTQNDVISN